MALLAASSSFISREGSLSASTLAQTLAQPGGPLSQQRVVVTSFNAADPLSTLAVVDGPVPVPGEGEVLIKITARPVNPADVFSIMGVYPGFAPASLPATPGLEGAGTVVNANGTSLSIGQRGVVFPSAVTGDGSWQEYVVVKASSFLPVPDSVSDAVAGMYSPPAPSRPPLVSF